MLKIPMKIVHNLTSGRFQLRCMCNTLFIFAPLEKYNTNEKGEAECPNCSSIWDGEIPTEDAEVDLSFKYFSLAIRLKQDNNLKDNEYVVIATGRGVDILHFGLPSIANLHNKIPPNRLEGVSVREISREEYDQTNEHRKEHMISHIMGMFKTLMED